MCSSGKKRHLVEIFVFCEIIGVRVLGNSGFLPCGKVLYVRQREIGCHSRGIVSFGGGLEELLDAIGLTAGVEIGSLAPNTNDLIGEIGLSCTEW